nr:uncharacterized protein LOC124819373 [Hydra vulgaris]
MVRNYKPKRQKNYNAEIFQAALQTIIDGETISTAAKQFNIPRTTLIDKLQGKHQIHSISGKTIFFKNQEETLVQRLLYMADRGFPLTIMWLRSAAYFYAKSLCRRHLLQKSISKSWHNKCLASRDWFLSFRKRHTQLTLRIPEGLSRARAEAFNENRVQTFFNDLQPFYEQLDIKNYPNLIYNCDETGLSSVPNVSVKVIALKGSHEVQKLTIGEHGTLTTYLATVNAAGDSLPPFFIFKGTKIPDASKFPLGTKVHCSQSGYIDQEIFIAYLHHFNEFCTKVNGKKVLLFLDGHKSHVTIEAIELAIKMDIEIICIPPHSTHRLQPHVNKVVKHMWSEALSNYLAENDDFSLPRCNFHIIFNKIWPNILTKRGLIVNAFYHCSLHPLRNPVKDFEYKKAEVFNKATIHQGDQNLSILRTIIPSPEKKRKPTHSKRHIALITSPGNVKLIKKPPAKKAAIKNVVSVKQKSKKDHDKSVKTKSKKTFFSADSDHPNSSSFILKNNTDKDFCCVCAAVWAEASEDWLKCLNCNQWACEGCFGVDTCANCVQ